MAKREENVVTLTSAQIQVLGQIEDNIKKVLKADDSLEVTIEASENYLDRFDDINLKMIVEDDLGFKVFAKTKIRKRLNTSDKHFAKLFTNAVTRMVKDIYKQLADINYTEAVAIQKTLDTLDKNIRF